MPARLFPWLVLCLLHVSAASAAPAGPEYLAALAQLAEANDRAWSAADAEAFSSFFAEDATFRSGNGELRRGQAAIRSHFERSFAQRSVSMRRVSRVIHVEMIAPDIAAAEMDVTLEQMDEGTWSELSQWRNVALLRRDRTGWRIAYFRAVPFSWR